MTVVTLNAYVKTEAKLYAQAKRDYDEGKYASAASGYQNLVKDFPNSESRLLYQLSAELSNVRDQVYAAQADPSEALATANRFLAEWRRVTTQIRQIYTTITQKE